MRVSVAITNFSWPGGPTRLAAELAGIARQADEGGLDTIWLSDHALQLEPGTEPTQEMLEAYVHHRLTRPINSPAAITTPHPPILVAGTGEQKTLRLVARYAQACNLPDIPDGGATIRRKLVVLREHCAAEGRPYQDIEKTVSTRLMPGETPEAFTERARGLGELGVDHLVVLTSGPWTADALARLTAAVPAARQITPTGQQPG